MNPEESFPENEIQAKQSNQNEFDLENENEDEKQEVDHKDDDYGDMPKTEIPFFEKRLGTESYRNNDFINAIKHYSKALLGMQLLIKDNKIQDEETMTKMVKEIEILCNLNLAQCYIKMKEYKSAVNHASNVLKIETDNIKALYRRGISYIQLQEFEQADEDLKLAIRLEPSNSEIVSALNQLKQEKIKLNEKMKQMSQKMLNSLDYTDKNEKKEDKEDKETKSFFRKILEMPKNIASSTFYHLKMVYLIPLMYISENCCKKRLPSSFFKKNI